MITSDDLIEIEVSDLRKGDAIPIKDGDGTSWAEVEGLFRRDGFTMMRLLGTLWKRPDKSMIVVRKERPE